MVTIHLASTSALKYEFLQQISEKIKLIRNNELITIQKYPCNTFNEQPIDESTFDLCNDRMMNLRDAVELSQKSVGNDIIIALENGIFAVNNKLYDVCVMDFYIDNVCHQYSSFGIEIDSNLFNIFLIEERDKNISFGSFLSQKYDVESNNWMKDRRFGAIDRKDQFMDCFNKFYLDYKTETILDFPKPGILFKDITSIVVDKDMLAMLFSLLKRFIEDNFDIKSIDYFAGLDARGFYFAPLLANMFHKGFIPVRKAKKVPCTDKNKIVTENYGTEYSQDCFGLLLKDEYCGKNVIVLDDLLATGGSLVGAISVLRQAKLNVISAVTVYDVKNLRLTAHEKLTNNNINYKVLLSGNNTNISDFHPVNHEYRRLVDFNSPKRNLRQFTISTDEWNKQKINIEDFKNIQIVCTEKDKELTFNIIDNLSLLSKQKKEVNIISGLFSNGETKMEINTNVRNKHVIIVTQIRTGHINDDLMELFMILDALNRANSDKITVIMPYYPYSRSDKKDSPRCAIGAATIANIFNTMGVDNLVSLDLHAGQLQGLLRKGFHNLYIKNYMCDFMLNNYLFKYPREKWNDYFIIISPDAGAAKTIKSYSVTLGINNIILDKQRDYSKPSTVVKSRFIGDKEDFVGKTGLIIDDIGDTMGTMCSASKELVDNGLKDVIVFLTHGVFSGPAIERINNTPYIKEVVVTDTLPQFENCKLSSKIKVLSIAELVSRTIEGLVTGNSISKLF